MVAAGFSLRLQTAVSFSLRNLKVAATLPWWASSTIYRDCHVCL